MATRGHRVPTQVTAGSTICGCIATSCGVTLVMGNKGSQKLHRWKLRWVRPKMLQACTVALTPRMRLHMD